MPPGAPARETPGTQGAFGELLRGHREHRGVTQRQLADLSTVSIRAIRDLECGRARRPRTDTVRLIAAALRLTESQRADLEASALPAADPVAGPLPLTAPPEPLDLMVGRAAELAALRTGVLAGEDRLTVLTGLGGIGKTRIALELADLLGRSDGLRVAWSPDPHGEPVPAGPRRPGPAHPGGPALLVLDGLRPGDPRLPAAVDLLRADRTLRVLATARVAAGLPGERELALAPLALPDRRADREPAALAGTPAVALLLRLVRRTVPGFELTAAEAAAVVELCHRLDGIPAALAEVAFLFGLLTPAGVLAHVADDPLGWAEGRLLGLRCSLGAALDRLPADDADALRRLARAPGGWSVAEAAVLTGRSPAACAQAVGRLLRLGLVRPAHQGCAAGFQVLDLVGAAAG
ncbi:helix-turn-helix domain-containing protein [Kitasatospora sp. LaBMicrA B282]|uniref:helix-turn-helix domain-containing protein n=1 Tax=Kitasatospora sp. LaBMicrA B282 TaxID=3420949 RepID=UPI003D0EEAFA